jgi:hypothetical protein
MGAAEVRALYARSMCRNIRVLHHFQPPTTDEEIRAAALQFVRKVSGLNAPSQADQAAFERAIEDVAATTRHLLGALSSRGPARTREGEREKAKIRWAQREARMRG